MYDWLSESLLDSGTVVTANRRLARTLKRVHSEQQRRAGARAWHSPTIVVWQDWVAGLNAIALDQETLPTRINAHQSQWLWEKCWRQEAGEEFDNSDIGLASLVRMSRDSWQRLSDWQVPLSDIARMAQNKDQRLFAAVAGRYQSLLRREHMVDDAGLGGLLLKLLCDDRIRLSHRCTIAGFNRSKPLVLAILEALRARGADIRTAAVADNNSERSLQSFENGAAELRAAGAWARDCIEANAAALVAVIVDDIEVDTSVKTRLVREGATPGWQHGPQSLRDAINVSYGRKLSEYPAIAVALMVLRWLVRDISSPDLSLLLRSGLLGAGNLPGRSRFELQLRQLPGREWSPAMVSAQLRGSHEAEACAEWLAHLAAFSKRRREIPKSASPTEWAVFVDETLQVFAWPGATPLSSAAFQLTNRWRELLNEFARLSLVSSRMPPAAVVARLELMADSSVFQAESDRAVVQVMGVLEASGAEFDALWITGLSSNRWPSSGTPSVLVSRRLQEERGMPDCTPEDTLRQAEETLAGFFGSADQVVCSYALSEDDTEQSATGLLSKWIRSDETAGKDPGWYASTLMAAVDLHVVADTVPAVTAGEKISGGAALVQRQIADPVSAFVQSRMSAKVIYPQAVGIPALIRGNLIHAALYKLYVELPSSQQVQSWSANDLDARIRAALDYGFARYEKNADSVLRQLLKLERHRVATLLRQFVAVDCCRDEFKVASVEGEFEFLSGHIRLPLRFDRIDTYSDGSVAILDYKTGAGKQLLTRAGEAKEIQLFVYASATTAAVAALALANIDSREISFDGAGRGYTNADEWPQLLQKIQQQVAVACEEIAAGDVRINFQQGVQTARALNVLTRYTELRREQG